MKKHSENSKHFWDKEYKESEHLKLSLNPSEDLERFCSWLIRHEGRRHLQHSSQVLDIGCGNGRNLRYLAETYRVRGTGLDISSQALAQATEHALNLPLTYTLQSAAEPLPVADNSQDIVLDMMVSHFLNENERGQLLAEIKRVLKPGGWLFYKTFLLDEDKHAKRLITEQPAPEANSYIHPVMNVAEHVSSEEEIRSVLGADFEIHQLRKSHRHKGPRAKRRSVSVYAERF